MPHRLVAIAAFTLSLLAPAIVSGQYVMENLGRGVVVVRGSETSVYVGWRLLGSDPAARTASTRFQRRQRRHAVETQRSTDRRDDKLR